MDSADILVVGAGIGGLTLAATLAGRGVAARVVEAAPAFGDIGAGIQLSPNATRQLDRLGVLHRLRHDGAAPTALTMRSWSADSELHRTELGSACVEEYGHPYLCVSRTALHAALVEAASAVSIEHGFRAVDVISNADGIQLIGEDGSVREGSFAIGADGIRSVVRQALHGDEPAAFTGVSAYRAVIEDPAIRLDEVTIWLGPGRHLVAYPIGRGRISLAASVRRNEREESWTAAASPDDLAEEYATWCPRVTALVGSVTAVQRWALHDRPAVRHWHTTRSALIGDAAHPMVPFGAQGAAQAIEDAVTLGHLIDPGAIPDAAALARYADVRGQRLADVLDFVAGNVADHHLEDGSDQQERDGSMEARHGLRRQRWLYGHDPLDALAGIGA